MTPLSVLAQEAATDPTGGLLSYGVLGIVVVMLVTGVLVPGYLYKRAEAENDRLRTLIDEKVYPTVEASTRATEQAIEVMRDVVDSLQPIAPPPTRRPRQQGR